MTKWQGKKILVIGAARQGIALARYLVLKGATVILNDQRSLDQLQDARWALQDLPVEWVVGGHPLSVLEGVHMVCISGGVPLTLPLIQEAIRLGIYLSNDSQIFMEVAPCRVIGITGSAGKTTTTTLVGRIAQQAAALRENAGPGFYPNRVWVGGNIGMPLISSVDEMQANDLVVMELSSFQLELMNVAPQVGAVLNITPNHLDRHATMQDYIEAKAHLVEYQLAVRPDWPCATVLGLEDANAWALRARARNTVWTFGHRLSEDQLPGAFLEGDWLMLWDGRQPQRIMARSDILLRGEHNVMNVLAACAICAAAGLPTGAMREGVQGFNGVPHRLEFVRSWGGAAWYNDSIATAPERAMAGLRSFSEPIVLLAGGRDKNLPWEAFARLVQERVDHLILFGEAAPIIHNALLQAGSQAARPFTIHICTGLQEAVQTAAHLVQAGDVVLLSPGGTSYGEFRDFEERGEAFRKWVLEL
ncbi:MAG: UDP-N-acetylmuramoyl-L-alanine--D-glutamate ligase [Anaerolineales bacterium]|jgi:UDP-N-acetylmuramoylalanine--D-glutamate ligase|nr:UDP-N-acetylmuramoyl-L-alanine--D-glutamate ligase [Anaerolineales bacterium]